MKRRWLSHTRSTLDQVGVTAESLLEFTPMHKVARVQLPDLQMIDARLDYSVPVFTTVVQLCRELGEWNIRDQRWGNGRPPFTDFEFFKIRAHRTPEHHYHIFFQASATRRSCH